jgi:hypothetical protein
VRPRPNVQPIATNSSSACVIRKIANTGTSVLTDSFTPRMFITVRTQRPNTITGSFQPSAAFGRNENTASAPLAIEIVIVST